MANKMNVVAILDGDQKVLKQSLGFQGMEETSNGPVWNYCNLRIHFVIPTSTIENCVQEAIARIPQVRFVFFLSTSYGSPVPVELNGGYGDSEVTINKYNVFAITSSYLVGHPESGLDGYFDCHNGVRISLPTMMKIKGVIGVSSNHPDKEAIFRSASKISYRIAVLDCNTYAFYHAMDSLPSKQCLVLTCVRGTVDGLDLADQHVCFESLLSKLHNLITNESFAPYLNNFPSLNDRFYRAPAAAPIVKNIGLLEEPKRTSNVSSIGHFVVHPERHENDAIRLRHMANNVAKKPAADIQMLEPPSQDVQIKDAEIERLNHRIATMQKENDDLVIRLNAAENAKTRIEQEHMAIIVSLIQERTRMAKQDPQEDKGKCKMCFVNDIDTVALPCTHAVLCSECSNNLKSHPELPSSRTCVLCRGNIQQVISMKMA
jgi:Zinc finger, C3HC4 type (RING finger)